MFVRLLASVFVWQGVKSNRIGTRDISAVPSFASEECKTMQRGEVFEEETSLDDDFMAEILAEEKAKQQVTHSLKMR